MWRKGIQNHLLQEITRQSQRASTLTNKSPTTKFKGRKNRLFKNMLLKGALNSNRYSSCLRIAKKSVINTPLYDASYLQNVSSWYDFPFLRNVWDKFWAEES